MKIKPVEEGGGGESLPGSLTLEPNNRTRGPSEQRAK